MSLQQDPLQFTSITSVVWITGGSDFRSIAAGARQTCGPTSAGIQCWDFVGGQTSLGWDFGCAIETGGGSFLDCWVNNSSGQTAMDPSQFPSANSAPVSSRPVLAGPFSRRPWSRGAVRPSSGGVSIRPPRCRVSRLGPDMPVPSTPTARHFADVMARDALANRGFPRELFQHARRSPERLATRAPE